MLDEPTLHDGMILLTLNLSFHGFTLCFPKRPDANQESSP